MIISASVFTASSRLSSVTSRARKTFFTSFSGSPTRSPGLSHSSAKETGYFSSIFFMISLHFIVGKSLLSVFDLCGQLFAPLLCGRRIYTGKLFQKLFCLPVLFFQEFF